MIPHSPKDIFNHITGRQGFDYDQIEESVFIGTNMCCQFGFDKVYIHCQHGHGRAPTLFVAYLVRNGMGVEKTIEYLKNKRPSIHLSDLQMKSLVNFSNRNN